MASISELDFSDLYVRIDPDTPSLFPSRYHPSERSSGPKPNLRVPEEFDESIEGLRPLLKEPLKDDFAVEYEGIRLRAARQAVIRGEIWVAMRRFARDIPVLEKLGFRPEILQTFSSWGTRSGLIVIGGATGAGKTTTAVALIREYMVKLGGTAYTIEDPVEYVLENLPSEECQAIQREVHEDHEWGEAVKKALRSAPAYIFLGEVRTPAAARQLLRAATSGHLAICTVHGGSIEETLAAILQIAEPELGSMAYTLLADGLTAVIHQKIVRKRPQVTILEAEAGNFADPTRAAIRTNKLLLLGTEIQRQTVLREQNARGELSDASPVYSSNQSKVERKPEPTRPEKTREEQNIRPDKTASNAKPINRPQINSSEKSASSSRVVLKETTPSKAEPQPVKKKSWFG